MTITAQMVRELRELTGAGMMECKKILTEANGDMDIAVDLLRKKGMASADKKSARIAAEGVVAISVSSDATKALLLELNCETDFVAKGDEFKDFANLIAEKSLLSGTDDIEKINQLDIGGQTVEEGRRAIVAKIGENISVRRVQLVSAESGVVGVYQHGDRIGVLAALSDSKDAAGLGKDVAMHIAASKPLSISADDLSENVLQREREIYKAQAIESGKPAEIAEKMVDGKMKKYIKEVTLLGQPFIKDPDQTIEQLLKSNNATVSTFCRFEVGEGIEKKQENFADEVQEMANSLK
jgi:elongation factor Ts